MTINISNKDGTYSRELKSVLPEINARYASDDLETYREFVISVVEPARFNKNAKPRMLYDLRNCKTKDAIIKRVYNAVLNAEHYDPTLRY